jgi:phage terminase small subunit
MAWYSAKTAYSIGSENLKKPEIIEALKLSLGKKFENAWIDGQWVIDRLVELVNRCMQKVPVVYFDKEEKEYKQKTEEDENWVEQWLRTFDSSGANTALANLGKYFKLFNDNPNINLTLTTIVKKIWQKK